MKFCFHLYIEKKVLNLERFIAINDVYKKLFIPYQADNQNLHKDVIHLLSVLESIM